MTTFNITAENTVGELVTRHPGLARVFEVASIDYCCGGKRKLSDVCQEKEIDPKVFIESLKEAADSDQDENLTDAGAMSLTELADHIEQTHHNYLRGELPRLAQITSRVADVHGLRDPRLSEVRNTFMGLAREMLSHLGKEEQVLFPMIRQIDKCSGQNSFNCGNVADPIRQMELEHTDAGAALEQLRSLTNNYTAPDWACNTYRAMLHSLAELERDLHMHVHKEDNILYPRSIKRQAELRQ